MSRNSYEDFIAKESQKIVSILKCALKKFYKDKAIADHVDWIGKGYILGAASYAVVTLDIMLTVKEKDTMIKAVIDKTVELLEQDNIVRKVGSSKKVRPPSQRKVKRK